MTAAVLQILYLLEIGTLNIVLITMPYDFINLWHVDWSLSSELIAALWGRYAPSGYFFDIHDRTGQRIAHFTDAGLSAALPAHRLPGRLAFAVGDRLATAQEQQFTVRNLRSGRLLGTQGPASAGVMNEAGMADAHMVADATGSRLAFCGKGSLDMHLYDAVSLEAQGTVRIIEQALVNHLCLKSAKPDSFLWSGGRFYVRAAGEMFLKSQPVCGVSMLCSVILQLTSGPPSARMGHSCMFSSHGAHLWECMTPALGSASATRPLVCLSMCTWLALTAGKLTCG